MTKELRARPPPAVPACAQRPRLMVITFITCPTGAKAGNAKDELFRKLFVP